MPGGAVDRQRLYWGEGSFADRLPGRKVLYAVMLVGFGVACILILRGLNGSSTAGLTGPVGPLSYALTQSRVVVAYVGLFFFPVVKMSTGSCLSIVPSGRHGRGFWRSSRLSG